MAKRNQKRNRGRKGTTMVFERHNYMLLLTGLAVVVAGYILMRVENEVDGLLSLYVAPLMLLGGYLGIIYAILWKPSEPDESTPA